MTIKFEPTWESLSQFAIPDWYEDAKFGIFIHWGVYSVPAFDNEWYSRNMYLPGSRAYQHHQETWGHQSKFGYKDFIPMLTAEKFDADAWADLFLEAGARYIVPVAEHHDGFAMYDSALSKWTAAQMGPRRDVIGQLAEAARKKGITFGLSSHRIEHWWFMNGGRLFDSDVQDPAYDEFYGPATSGPLDWNDPMWDTLDWTPRPNAKFLEDWLARCCELVDKYRPNVFYFDWWIQQVVAAPYIQRFASYYYNRGQEWGQGVAINHKHHAFPEGVTVFDMERGQLTEIRPELWQTCTSVMRNSWCVIDAPDYKPSSEVLHELIDVVSKNGTMLLNIGPRADGTIPEGDQAILRDIGGWLKVNGEAIYETRPWKIYGEGPTKVPEGQFQDAKKLPFTPQDIRFTTKGDTLYATALGVPTNGEAVIVSLGTDADLYTGAIGRVELLGSAATLDFTREADGLHIKLPSGLTADAITFRITA